MTFVKADPAPLEAAGLRWLAEAGARVPRIVSSTPSRLELERIESGALDAAGEEELGRMLARLHLAGAPHFGPCRRSGASSSDGANSTHPRPTIGTPTT